MAPVQVSLLRLYRDCNTKNLLKCETNIEVGNEGGWYWS